MGKQWDSEQEVFEGPRAYETEGGRFPERIVISYNTEASSGAFKGLYIEYRGPGPMRVPGEDTNFSLTVADVDPWLRKRGFKE